MKLARELSKRQTGRTLYLLDEPTTGLHFDDVRKLLEVLHRLTDLGNTVIIIEHNLDVIRNADWVIDLGPEGGEEGGNLIAEGTPAQVAATLGSYTGEFLRRYFPAHELKPFAASAAGSQWQSRPRRHDRQNSGVWPMSNDPEILSHPTTRCGSATSPVNRRATSPTSAIPFCFFTWHHLLFLTEYFRLRTRHGLASVRQGDAAAAAPRTAAAHPHHGHRVPSPGAIVWAIFTNLWRRPSLSALHWNFAVRATPLYAFAGRRHCY